MSTGELVYKKVESAEDVQSTIAFLNSVLPHKIDDQIWEWEFNAFPEDVVLTIIKDGAPTVGTQFMLPIGMNVAGVPTISGKCENSYFNNAYRGQGLFQKLFAYAEEISTAKKIDLLWAFTPATKVYKEKLNFHVFTDLLFSVSLFTGNPGMRFFRSYTKSGYKSYLKYVYYRLKHALFLVKSTRFFSQTGYAEKIKQYEVKNTPASFGEVDKLYGKLHELNGKFVHVRVDKAYFDWRIHKNVNLDYKTYFFYRNGELAGYYVYAYKDNVANITDLTTIDAETATTLFGHLLKEVKKQGVYRVNYFGNSSHVLNARNFNLFQRFGARLQLVSGMPFVYKNTAGSKFDDSLLSYPENWYLNGLWTEGFTY